MPSSQKMVVIKKETAKVFRIKAMRKQKILKQKIIKTINNSFQTKT